MRVKALLLFYCLFGSHALDAFSSENKLSNSGLFIYIFFQNSRRRIGPTTQQSRRDPDDNTQSSEPFRIDLLQIYLMFSR